MALLTGAALLTGLLQGVQATGSQARTPTGSHTAALSLNGLEPAVPASDGSLTVSGTVVNNSRSEITDAHIGVRLGSGGPLGTRSAVKDVLNRGGYNSDLDGSADIDGHTAHVENLGAGLTTAFSLKIPVSALGLGSSGVYQLSVTLDGQTAPEPYQHVLGIARTFLPWYQQGDAKPTRISYLWPLIDKPHIAPQGDSDSQQSPIFLDDKLADELKPGGRLQEMVDLAKDLPVTWVVDPDLLASVEAMTKPYRVVAEEDASGHIVRTTLGTGTADAKNWLNALRTAVSGAPQVISLPFGDTDIASLAHHAATTGADAQHGAGPLKAVDRVKTGLSLGKITTDTILGVKSDANVAWPVNGAIDPSIVSVARNSGASRIIARSDTFSDGAVGYTPSAPRPIGGGTTAVVADASLSNAFSGNMLYAGAAQAAVQNFVAQTLLITMQAPQRQRDVLVAPQRTPSVSQAQAMAAAITQVVDNSSWAETVSFNDAAKSTPDPKASHKVPSAAAYPKSLRRQELSAPYFGKLGGTQAELNGFVGILTIKDRVTVPFSNAMLRAMSTGWRLAPQGATDPADPTDRTSAVGFRNSINEYLGELMGAVHVLKKTPLTLSGRSGTIPVTVKNDLGQPITGLTLRLTSDSHIRLKIKNPLQPITVDGGHSRTLKFQTTATANGKVGITASLYTANGALYGSKDDAVTFNIKITKVTDLVMLIIAAGLLLLVLAGVRIYRQRKRQAAADGGDGGSEGGSGKTSGAGGSGGDEGDGEMQGAGAGQPGDPAADTSPQSPEPSSTGEKVDG
ncbi:hypothetical protein GA0115240_11955 [Streptomyces sp. DvalAA-14]|uniref:DUF6049 family protein n=1 Tax=unclassified Streptomyces TaxID=2593676 RepID=UPI00081B83EB|nr:MULTISPECIES: DUF6049 family protein [unclassified Streptomyces]MYS20388.1 hypothetical protein [Streptomyces sp. SID4948]SCD67971.1 hypothetical protein GA0115240_11955 [Streptomyces sp. DvalAA-14]